MIERHFPHLASGRVSLLVGKTVVRILVENKRAVGVELMDEGLETIMAGEIVLSAGIVHSPTVLMHSALGRPSSCASKVPP
jgi:choline dehydrogenase-like flavoprotein